ncbi:ABC-three component system middle component 4 [Pseudomonas sp. YH-1]|uniref:ABC-three component system middle component 4 n=1 Tax=Pseudomonas sp. YH-1 TaxID=3384787 RepID=UPI003F7E8AC7
MKKVLPFIAIDEELEFNLVITMVALSWLSHDSKSRPILSFERLQCYVYLIKNPARIGQVLFHAGKKVSALETRYTYTIESMSGNVDILFDRDKLRSLLTKLARFRFLSCIESEKGEFLAYSLSEKGQDFIKSFVGADGSVNGYAASLVEFADRISSLNSLPVSKLNSILNLVFKGE